VVSSEQMVNQRFKEEFFLRIPLNILGGTGKFGRENLSTFIELKPCIRSSDDSKSSSLTSENGPINSIKLDAFPF